MSMPLALAVPDEGDPRERRAPRTFEDAVCAGCGYGVAGRRSLPERCPMCGNGDWSPARPARRPRT